MVHGFYVRFEVVFCGEFLETGGPVAEVDAAFVERGVVVEMHVVAEIAGAARDVRAEFAVRGMCGRDVCAEFAVGGEAEEALGAEGFGGERGGRGWGGGGREVQAERGELFGGVWGGVADGRKARGLLREVEEEGGVAEGGVIEEFWGGEGEVAAWWGGGDTHDGGRGGLQDFWPDFGADDTHCADVPALFEARVRGGNVVAEFAFGVKSCFACGLGVVDVLVGAGPGLKIEVVFPNVAGQGALFSEARYTVAVSSTLHQVSQKC